MAVTQAMIDALERALFNGELRVDTGNGKSVTYRSIEDIRSVLAEARGQLNGTISAPDALASRRTRIASNMDRGGSVAGDCRVNWR